MNAGRSVQVLPYWSCYGLKQSVMIITAGGYTTYIVWQEYAGVGSVQVRETLGSYVWTMGRVVAKRKFTRNEKETNAGVAAPVILTVHAAG